MSTGTHLARTHIRTRARRVTHRTAFAANNYVRDFSVAVYFVPHPLPLPSLSLSPLSPSYLPLPPSLSRSHSLSFFSSLLLLLVSHFDLNELVSQASRLRSLARTLVIARKSSFPVVCAARTIGTQHTHSRLLSDWFGTGTNSGGSSRRSCNKTLSGMRGCYAHKSCSKRVFKYL